MAITSRQFEQLSEMGISLWQSRATSNNDTVQADIYLPQSQQSLTALSKETIFTDILLSLNLTIGEITAKNDHLDCGLFDWHFLDKNEICYRDNKLFSPDIKLIAQSTQLKKQLWHTISHDLL